MPELNPKPKYKMHSHVMKRIMQDNKHVGWEIGVTMERDGVFAVRAVDVIPEDGVAPYKVEIDGRLLDFETLVVNTINEHNLVGQCNEALDG